MSRHVAFLRGVNLGKRQTRSADLVAVFEGLGFSGVKTLIASGNVKFETKATKDLAGRIEAALEAHFGFSIGVVLRSMDELEAMVASAPFAGVDPRADVNNHVLMFASPIERPKLTGVAGDYDVARIDARDIYFTVYRKEDGTYLGRSALGETDKQLPKGVVSTMRNWNTILKAVG